MNRPHQRVYQGVRSDRYSRSKLTNWTDFHPRHSAISQACFQHRPYLRKKSEGTLLVIRGSLTDRIIDSIHLNLAVQSLRFPYDAVRELALGIYFS